MLKYVRIRSHVGHGTGVMVGNRWQTIDEHDMTTWSLVGRAIKIESAADVRGSGVVEVKDDLRMI